MRRRERKVAERPRSGPQVSRSEPQASEDHGAGRAERGPPRRIWMTHGEGATPLEREDDRASHAWMVMAERGSFRALRVIRWFYPTLGRRATIAFLTPVVAYFFVPRRAPPRVSLGYLRTLRAAPRGPEALGARPPSR